MSDADNIGDYVRANRDRYASAAMRAELVARGYPPEAVDAVLAEQAAANEDSPIEPTVSVRGRGLLIALVACVLGAVLIGASFGRSVSDGFQLFTFRTAFEAGLLYLSPGFLVSAVLILLINRQPVPRSQVVNAVFAGLAAPFIILLVMTGVCLSFAR